MAELQDNNGNKSSMRANTRMIIYMVCFLLFTVGVYILVSVFKGVVIDAGAWGGIGGFLAGIASLVSGAMFMQQKQKKEELNNEIKDL